MTVMTVFEKFTFFKNWFRSATQLYIRPIVRFRNGDRQLDNIAAIYAMMRMPMMKREGCRERTYIYNMSATHDVHVRDLTSVCSRTSRMTLWRLACYKSWCELRSSFGRGREKDRRVKSHHVRLLCMRSHRCRADFARVAFISISVEDEV